MLSEKQLPFSFSKLRFIYVFVLLLIYYSKQKFTYISKHYLFIDLSNFFGRFRKC